MERNKWSYEKKMTELMEQLPITIHPEGYTNCGCCANCQSKNICSLGEFGDHGICHGYVDDGSSGK